MLMQSRLIFTFENITIQSGVGLFYFLTSFEIQQWANENFVSRNL
jgi:hypothetical protein